MAIALKDYAPTSPAPNASSFLELYAFERPPAAKPMPRFGRSSPHSAELASPGQSTPGVVTQVREGVYDMPAQRPPHGWVPRA